MKPFNEIKEHPGVALTAAAGAAEGIYKYYVKPEITAKRSWAVLGGFVLLHDVLCSNGQTLSEGADRALDRHPVLTRVAIGLTALHLANALPPTLDPIHQAVELMKGLR